MYQASNVPIVLQSIVLTGRNMNLSSGYAFFLIYTGQLHRRSLLPTTEKNYHYPQLPRIYFLRRDAYSTFCMGAGSNTSATAQWPAPKTKTPRMWELMDSWISGTITPILLFEIQITISCANIFQTSINKSDVTSGYDQPSILDSK